MRKPSPLLLAVRGGKVRDIRFDRVAAPGCSAGRTTRPVLVGPVTALPIADPPDFDRGRITVRHVLPEYPLDQFLKVAA